MKAIARENSKLQGVIDLLDATYQDLRIYVNFFQPVLKLGEKC